MTDKELLHAKLKEKITLPVGDVLSDSFDLFGKGAGKYIGFLLVCLAGLVVISLTSIVSVYVSITLFIAFALIASPALQVGLARFTKKLKEGNEPQFSDFFSGFKYNLGNLILQGVLIGVITAAATYAVDMNYYNEYFQAFASAEGDVETMTENLAAFGQKYSAFSWRRTLGSLFTFYLAVGLSLTPYIVSFYNVNAIVAMDVSFRTINKVVGQALLIRFVLVVLAAMGAFVLLVGLFATLPIFFIGSYLMFKYTLGEKPGESQEEWDVNQHLVP
jgi:tetrahydromethanopterin S-methyltransferase subunit G